MTHVLPSLLGEVEGALELEAPGLQHNKQERPRVGRRGWTAVLVLGEGEAPEGPGEAWTDSTRFGTGWL